MKYWKMIVVVSNRNKLIFFSFVFFPEENPCIFQPAVPIGLDKSRINDNIDCSWSYHEPSSDQVGQKDLSGWPSRSHKTDKSWQIFNEFMIVNGRELRIWFFFSPSHSSSLLRETKNVINFLNSLLLFPCCYNFFFS